MCWMWPPALLRSGTLCAAAAGCSPPPGREHMQHAAFFATCIVFLVSSAHVRTWITSHYTHIKRLFFFTFLCPRRIFIQLNSLKAFSFFWCTVTLHISIVDFFLKNYKNIAVVFQSCYGFICNNAWSVIWVIILKTENSLDFWVVTNVPPGI